MSIFDDDFMQSINSKPKNINTDLYAEALAAKFRHGMSDARNCTGTETQCSPIASLNEKQNLNPHVSRNAYQQTPANHITFYIDSEEDSSPIECVGTYRNSTPVQPVTFKPLVTLYSVDDEDAFLYGDSNDDENSSLQNETSTEIGSNDDLLKVEKHGFDKQQKSLLFSKSKDSGDDRNSGIKLSISSFRKQSSGNYSDDPVVDHRSAKQESFLASKSHVEAFDAHCNSPSALNEGSEQQFSYLLSNLDNQSRQSISFETTKENSLNSSEFDPPALKTSKHFISEKDNLRNFEDAARRFSKQLNPDKSPKTNTHCEESHSKYNKLHQEEIEVIYDSEKKSESNSLSNKPSKVSELLINVHHEDGSPSNPHKFKKRRDLVVDKSVCKPGDLEILKYIPDKTQVIQEPVSVSSRGESRDLPKHSIEKSSKKIDDRYMKQQPAGKLPRQISDKYHFYREGIEPYSGYGSKTKNHKPRSPERQWSPSYTPRRRSRSSSSPRRWSPDIYRRRSPSYGSSNPHSRNRSPSCRYRARSSNYLSRDPKRGSPERFTRHEKQSHERSPPRHTRYRSGGRSPSWPVVEKESWLYQSNSPMPSLESKKKEKITMKRKQNYSSEEDSDEDLERLIAKVTGKFNGKEPAPILKESDNLKYDAISSKKSKMFIPDENREHRFQDSRASTDVSPHTAWSAESTVTAPGYATAPDQLNASNIHYGMVYPQQLTSTLSQSYPQFMYDPASVPTGPYQFPPYDNYMYPPNISSTSAYNYHPLIPPTNNTFSPVNLQIDTRVRNQHSKGRISCLKSIPACNSDVSLPEPTLEWNQNSLSTPTHEMPVGSNTLIEVARSKDAISEIKNNSVETDKETPKIYKKLLEEKEAIKTKLDNTFRHLIEIKDLKKMLEKKAKLPKIYAVKQLNIQCEYLYKRTIDEVSGYNKEFQQVSGQLKELIAKIKPGTLEKIAKEVEEKKSKQSSNVRYAGYDTGGHWCEFCKQNFPTIPQMMDHLQSEIHTKYVDPLKVITQESPKEVIDRNSKLWPIKGVEFMKPLHAFYCSLCKEILSNQSYAEYHLKGSSHIEKYVTFLKENPVYERKREILKEATAVIETCEKRQRDLEKIRLAKKLFQEKQFREAKIKLKDADKEIQNKTPQLKYNDKTCEKLGESNLNGQNIPIAENRVKLSLKNKKRKAVEPFDSLKPAISKRLEVKPKVVYVGRAPNFKPQSKGIKKKCIFSRTKNAYLNSNSNAKVELNYLNESSEVESTAPDLSLSADDKVKTSKNKLSGFNQIRWKNRTTSSNKNVTGYQVKAAEKEFELDSYNQSSERPADKSQKNQPLYTTPAADDTGVTDIEINKGVVCSEIKVESVVPSIEKGLSVSGVSPVDQPIFPSLTAGQSCKKGSVQQESNTERLSKENNDRSMLMDKLSSKDARIKEVQKNNNSEISSEVENIHQSKKEDNFMLRTGEPTTSSFSSGEINLSLLANVIRNTETMIRELSNDFVCPEIEYVSDVLSNEKELLVSGVSKKDKSTFASLSACELNNKSKGKQMPDTQMLSKDNSKVSMFNNEPTTSNNALIKAVQQSNNPESSYEVEVDTILANKEESNLILRTNEPTLLSLSKGELNQFLRTALYENEGVMDMEINNDSVCMEIKDIYDASTTEKDKPTLSSISAGDINEKYRVQQVSDIEILGTKNSETVILMDEPMSSKNAFIKNLQQNNDSESSHEVEVLSVDVNKEEFNLMIRTNEPTLPSFSAYELKQSLHASVDVNEDNSVCSKIKDISGAPFTEKELPVLAANKPTLPSLSAVDFNDKSSLQKVPDIELLEKENGILTEDVQRSSNSEIFLQVDVETIQENKEENNLMLKTNEPTLTSKSEDESNQSLHVALNQNECAMSMEINNESECTEIKDMPENDKPALSSLSAGDINDKNSVHQVSDIEILGTENSETVIMMNEPMSSNNAFVKNLQQNNDSESSHEVEVLYVHVNKKECNLMIRTNEPILSSLSAHELKQSLLATVDANEDNSECSKIKDISGAPFTEKELPVLATDKTTLSSFSAVDLNDKGSLQKEPDIEMLDKVNGAFIIDVQQRSNSKSSHEVEVYTVYANKEESYLMLRTNEATIPSSSEGESNQVLYAKVDENEGVMDMEINNDSVCIEIKDITTASSTEKEITVPDLDKPTLSSLSAGDLNDKCSVQQVSETEMLVKENIEAVIHKNERKDAFIKNELQNNNPGSSSKVGVQNVHVNKEGGNLTIRTDESTIPYLSKDKLNQYSYAAVYVNEDISVCSEIKDISGAPSTEKELPVLATDKPTNSSVSAVDLNDKGSVQQVTYIELLEKENGALTEDVQRRSNSEIFLGVEVETTHTNKDESNLMSKTNKPYLTPKSENELKQSLPAALIENECARGILVPALDKPILSSLSVCDLNDIESVHKVSDIEILGKEYSVKLFLKNEPMSSNNTFIRNVHQNNNSESSHEVGVHNVHVNKKECNLVRTNEPTLPSLSAHELDENTGVIDMKINNDLLWPQIKGIAGAPSFEKELSVAFIPATMKATLSSSTGDINDKDSTQQLVDVDMLDKENGALIKDIQQNSNLEKTLEAKVENILVNKEEGNFMLRASGSTPSSLPAGELNQFMYTPAVDENTRERYMEINSDSICLGIKVVSSVPSTAVELSVSGVQAMDKPTLPSLSAGELSDKGSVQQTSDTEMPIKESVERLILKNDTMSCIDTLIKELQQNNDSKTYHKVEFEDIHIHAEEDNLILRTHEPIPSSFSADESNLSLHTAVAVNKNACVMDVGIKNDLACPEIKDLSGVPSSEKELPIQCIPPMEKPTLTGCSKGEFSDKCIVHQVPDSEQQNKKNDKKLIQKSIVWFFKARKYVEDSKVGKNSVNSCSENLLISATVPQSINIKESSSLETKAKDKQMDDQPTIISSEIFVQSENKDKMCSNDPLIKEDQQNNDSKSSHKVESENINVNMEEDKLILKSTSNMTEEFHDLKVTEKSNLSSCHSFEAAFSDFLKKNDNLLGSTSSEMGTPCAKGDEKITENKTNLFSVNANQRESNVDNSLNNSSSSNSTATYNENVSDVKKNTELIEDHLHKIQKADVSLKITQITGVKEIIDNNRSSNVEIVYDISKGNIIVDSTSKAQDIFNSTNIVKPPQENVPLKQDSIEHLTSIGKFEHIEPSQSFDSGSEHHIHHSWKKHEEKERSEIGAVAETNPISSSTDKIEVTENEETYKKRKMPSEHGESSNKPFAKKLKEEDRNVSAHCDTDD